MWELVSEALKARYTFKTVSCKLIHPDHFWQPGPIFSNQKWSGVGPILAASYYLLFSESAGRVV